MSEMIELCKIRDEIRLESSLNSFNNYFDSIRKWLNGQITLEEFDEMAQHYIPIELHTKFLLALISTFKVCFKYIYIYQSCDKILIFENF